MFSKVIGMRLLIVYDPSENETRLGNRECVISKNSYFLIVPIIARRIISEIVHVSNCSQSLHLSRMQLTVQFRMGVNACFYKAVRGFFVI